MVIGRGVTHVPAEIHLTFRLPVFARSPTPTPSSSVISIKCGGCGEGSCWKTLASLTKTLSSCDDEERSETRGKKRSNFPRVVLGKRKKTDRNKCGEVSRWCMSRLWGVVFHGALRFITGCRALNHLSGWAAERLRWSGPRWPLAGCFTAIFVIYEAFFLLPSHLFSFCYKFSLKKLIAPTDFPRTDGWWMPSWLTQTLIRKALVKKLKS